MGLPGTSVRAVLAPAERARPGNTHVAASVAVRSSPDAFDGYVARTPVAYALFRTAESHALGGLRLSRPVLDVGCGVGDFAAFALSAPVDAGVDLLGDRLALARSRGVYSGLAQTDAAALPLADATFATVISVSVLEHVRRPVEAVTEAFRVLRPGGRFLVTIVLSDLHAYLFYPWVFRRLRMPWLARRYARLHDWVFQHMTLQGQEEWERMIRAAGFHIVESRRIVCPRLTRWFDFLLIIAWPYKLMQCIGIAHPRFFARGGSDEGFGTGSGRSSRTTPAKGVPCY